MTLEKTLYDVGRELKDLPREVYDYLKDTYRSETYDFLRFPLCGFTKEEILEMWPQTKGELQGFQRHLERKAGIK